MSDDPHMSPVTRHELLRYWRRIRLLPIWVALGAPAGMIYGLLRYDMTFSDGAVGLLYGAIISATLGVLELLFSLAGGSWFDRLPFLPSLLVRVLASTAAIVAIFRLHPASLLFGLPERSTVGDGDFWVNVVFSLAIGTVLNFLVRIDRLLGPGTLMNFLLGRYHKPRVEPRFILFVDLQGSTGLAERLGPLAFHQFLDGVFRLASGPIHQQSGAILQYVGDQIVVTWPLRLGARAARPLACVAGLIDELERAAPVFQARFGAAPEVKASLHAGSVVVGEVGDLKREIVFHGDVMNTTARLEQCARDTGEVFIVSEAALQAMQGTERYAIRPLGTIQPRGRVQEIAVAAVDFPRTRQSQARRLGGSIPETAA